MTVHTDSDSSRSRLFRSATDPALVLTLLQVMISLLSSIMLAQGMVA